MMYRVIMIIDDVEYGYGTYKERDRANSIAMMVRDERNVDVYVEEIEG